LYVSWTQQHAWEAQAGALADLRSLTTDW
jgi:hypothetical protein